MRSSKGCPMTFSSIADATHVPAHSAMSTNLDEDEMGRLAVTFSLGGDGKTYVGEQFASYPFHVCRAQYVDDDPSGMATLYIQSSAGGIFENDRLRIAIAAESGAQAHMTTQASTIVHGMRNGSARQLATVAAHENAFIEYLPDPLILFPDSELFSHLRIACHPSATVIFTDAFMAHDPDGGNAPFRMFDNLMEIVDPEGRLLVRDRFTVTGETFLRGRRGTNGQFATHGTMIILCPATFRKVLIEELRVVLDGLPDAINGISRLPNDCGVILRTLATDGEALRTATMAAWSAVREALVGKPAPRRRK